MDLTLLGSTQLHSRTLLSLRTNAGAAGGVLGTSPESYRRFGPLLLRQ